MAVVLIITNWLTESVASAICTRTSARIAPSAARDAGGPARVGGRLAWRAIASGSGRRKKKVRSAASA